MKKLLILLSGIVVGLPMVATAQGNDVRCQRTISYLNHGKWEAQMSVESCYDGVNVQAEWTRSFKLAPGSLWKVVDEIPGEVDETDYGQTLLYVVVVRRCRDCKEVEVQLDGYASGNVTGVSGNVLGIKRDVEGNTTTENLSPCPPEGC